MDASDAKNVIKDLQEKPFICGQNTIETESGYVIKKKLTNADRIRSMCDEELEAYRASVFSGDMTQKMLKEEYNKAVDDFAKLLRETRDDRTLRVNCDDLEIRHMAERLKGGDGE